MNDLNQHKFISVVPMSALSKDFNFNIGTIVDIEIIGKATLIACTKIADFAYYINKNTNEIYILNLTKGKQYIKILYRS